MKTYRREELEAMTGVLTGAVHPPGIGSTIVRFEDTTGQYVSASYVYIGDGTYLDYFAARTLKERAIKELLAEGLDPHLWERGAQVWGRVRHMVAPNVRFWHWHSTADQWVKITLKPGQSLGCSRGCRTDEGYSFECIQWEYVADEQVVICSQHSSGCDCDGRTSDDRDYVCAVDKLQSVAGVEELDRFGRTVSIGPRRPDWKPHGQATCYDQFAENMNY